MTIHIHIQQRDEFILQSWYLRNSPCCRMIVKNLKVHCHDCLHVWTLAAAWKFKSIFEWLSNRLWGDWTYNGGAFNSNIHHVIKGHYDKKRSFRFIELNYVMFQPLPTPLRYPLPHSQNLLILFPLFGQVPQNFINPDNPPWTLESSVCKIS